MNAFGELSESVFYLVIHIKIPSLWDSSIKRVYYDLNKIRHQHGL